MTASLFDSHCHLDDRRLRQERDAVLHRARAAGVGRLTTIGCARDPGQVDAGLHIARQHPDWITTTVGVHPHDARHLDETLVGAMQRVASDPQVVAIGETGLDLHYEHSPPETQRNAFRRQVALARELRLPIVVHSRKAPQDTLRILREEYARDVGGIIHCFAEDPAFAKAALDLGFVASFSGLVTFPNGPETVREAARTQPLDALLVETDAPYLAPVPRRGERNEPAFVSHTAAFVAQLRGMDEDELAVATTRNACRVFGIG